ncbi:uncharacterized protein LOC127869438 isoform X2 [Dreissena polymorpha]|uniref:uncharacterized protein LOC127869438 isoform X2 n=1 Tax=Dreissena polymorpha TaxID=45954 RepID=UPI0022652E66|nr:uncharacterized protein LOC127869438 isoform X2 [Dreissena polymorpha]
MAEGFYWRHESDHECVPNQSGLYCRHSQVQCEQASVEICIVMNCLGYGPEIRQARRDAQKECDRLMTAEWQEKVLNMMGERVREYE